MFEMRNDDKLGAYRILGIIQWVAGFLVVVIGASLKADGTKYPAPLSGWLIFFQNNAFWCIPLLMIAAGIAQLIRQQIGPPKTWSHIRFLLDEFRKLIFETDRVAHQRVTLFQYKKRITFREYGPKRCWYLLCIDRSGWLVPVQRSGQTSRRSASAFWAPDEADKAQGVAGALWAGITVDDIPYAEQLPEISLSSPDSVLKVYADKSMLTVEWLKKKFSRKKSGWPRALCGIPVEVKGKRWGVIVLDSRDEQIPNHDRVRTFYKTSASIIARLIDTL